jgi:hypothetical protein
MGKDSDGQRPAGARPRSKTFLQINLDNPYGRLGVSPLAPTSAIASRISELRGKAIKRVKAKAARSANDADEEQAHWLDHIAEQIGDPKKRKIYDERFPQNILLTVQPSLTEQAWSRHRRAGLISEWLCELLGQDAVLPAPGCLRLWAPNGLDAVIDQALAEFTAAGPAAPAPVVEEAGAPSIEDFDSLIKDKSNG